MGEHNKNYIAPGAVVLGDIEMGGDCSIWYNAVVRADRAPICIGSGSNVQDNCVVHVETDYPVTIGEGVTIGHGAIIHGCSIGNNTLIGMGAILLNGCQIGNNCMIGAGALITQNTVIPDNSLVIGNPGKVRREVTPEEIEHIRENAQHYLEEARESLGQ